MWINFTFPKGESTSPYRGFAWVSLERFGFPSRFAGVSFEFPFQGLSFPHLLKVWISFAFCKDFPRVSLSGFKFPSRSARVSLGFPSKGFGFPHVLQGFPSGFLLKVWATLTF